MERPFRAYQGTESYVFVTYSHSDADEVYPEMAWLDQQGVHVWYDEGIEPGTTWRTEIAEAIESAGVVIYFISAASAVSKHCLREISYALDNDKAVLPVYLEDTPLPPDLRLGLTRVQAIYLAEYQTDVYRDKLLHAITDQQTQSDTRVGRKKRRRGSRIAAYLVTLIVLLIGTGVIQQGGIFSGVSVAHASVAVLPFDSWSTDPNDEFITLGLTGEILNSLTQVDGLKVTSRTSSFAFKNKDANAKEIASRLGVRYLLEGSFRKEGNEFRVLVHLTDTQTGFQTTERYREPAESVFELQDKVARDVATSLQLEISVKEVPAPTMSGEAYQHYLVGREHQYRRVSGWTALAIAAYDRAIELDPGFAGAYARRSIARQLTSEGRARNAASRTLARTDFELALALNANNADALAAAGLYEMSIDPEQADRLLRSALEIDPDLPNARSWYTTNLNRLGRFREAIELRTEHLSHDPLNPLIHNNSIVSLIAQGDYRGAKGLALEAFQFPDTSFSGPYRSLFTVEMAFGEYARALAWISEALNADSNPNSSHLLLAHAEVSAVLGMFEEAHQQTDMAGERDRPRYETRLKILFRQNDRGGLKSLADTFAEVRNHRRIPFAVDQQLGSLYLQLGETQKAIDYLAPTFEGFNGVPLERAHFGPQDDAVLYLVKAFLLNGREQDAHSLLRDLDDYYALLEREGVSGAPNRLVKMALHRALSERANEAFLLLGRAIDRGWADYYALAHDARWDGLRDHPEFLTLLAEVERELAIERELVINHRRTDSLDVAFARETYQTAALVAR